MEEITCPECGLQVTYEGGTIYANSADVQRLCKLPLEYKTPAKCRQLEEELHRVTGRPIGSSALSDIELESPS
jgi:hypothetical protein